MKMSRFFMPYVTPSLLAKLGLGFFIFFSLAVKAQTNNIKIYSYKFPSVLHKNEIWWLFYKIDWDEKTIQYAQIDFKEDEKLNISNVSKIFKNAIPANKFIVLSANKIKVKRDRAKRNWLNFATPRTKSRSAENFFINGDTLGRRKKGGEFILDKDLTLRYQQEKHKR